MISAPISHVTIRSAGVRGRARLHVPELRRAPALARELEERLAADERVHRVEASPVTGNLLVLFDAGRLRLGTLREDIAAEVAAYRRRPRRRSPEGVALRPLAAPDG